MFGAEPASGCASARIFSSASVSVWAARRITSRNGNACVASRGSAAMNPSIAGPPMRRISGCMYDACALNSAWSCCISCCIPCGSLSRVSSSAVMLA